MANAIEFHDVSKRFTLHTDRRDTVQERITGLFRPRGQSEDYWALRGVSFEVPEGQSIALVGHNGAGKSTALKLMTRILEPTTGTVQMRGRIAALLELGSGFHPDLSGRENVFLNGSLMGFSRRDMELRLEEIIDFSGIGQFIDMEVKHYSSGMYTRLAFAVATSVDPDILITDEVLAVGDEAFQRKCMERIYSFRQQGKTIVFVSHALDTVRTLCDHAVWLEKGEPQLVGEAGEVVDAYLAKVNQTEAEALRKRGLATGAGEDTPYRRGTREIEIVRVELIGATGRDQVVFNTREPLTVRMHYVAHQCIERPVFGIGLNHESGFLISGPNTAFSHVDIASVQGAGHVDYVIESLPLLAGRYAFSVAAYDETMQHPYDHHDRLYPITVHSTGLSERYGVVPLAGGWKICDD